MAGADMIHAPVPADGLLPVAWHQKGGMLVRANFGIQELSLGATGDIDALLLSFKGKHEVHHIDGSSTLVVVQVSSAEQPAVDPPTSTTPLYEPPGSAERPPTPTATPLYDLFKSKLDDEECILFEAHAQKFFFSELLPTGVSVADKVEIFCKLA